jgi:hypothetical protein
MTKIDLLIKTPLIFEVAHAMIIKKLIILLSATATDSLL